MTTFIWTGRTRQGVHRNGEIAAQTRDEVIALLKKERLLITSVQEKGARWDLPRRNKKVSDRAVAIFTRQLSSMIEAGLPLVQSLEVLSKQPDNPFFSSMIAGIRIEVEGGATYTEAIRGHPEIFDELYVNMVAAGEASGQMEVVLRRLSKHIEKSIKLKRKIKSALVYPATIVGVAILVIIMLMIWVIPVFAKMYTDYGGELPLLTRWLIQISEFVKAYILLIAASVGLSIWGLKKYYKSPRGRDQIDRLLLRLPVIAGFVKKTAITRFTRMLGMLVSSGIPILEGIATSAKVSGNTVIEAHLLSACHGMREGSTLSAPLSQGKIFSEAVIQMIHVGETTGTLDLMLEKVADYHEEELEITIDVMTSLLEPALMVFVGVIIGTIVVAMYLPIFRMAALIE